MRRGCPGRDPRAQLPEAAAMLDRWAYVEFARFEACCFGVGAVLGLVVALIREVVRTTTTTD